MLSFLFCLHRGGGVEEGLEATHISWLIGVEGVAWQNILVDSSGLIISVKCGVISCCVCCLPAFNGTHIHWGRRNWRAMDGSSNWGLYSSSARITAIVASTLKGLGGKLRSLSLGGTIVCWLPNPYVTVGSLESESIVTIRGSGEATEEMVFVSFVIAPDSSVELRIAGVLFLIGLLPSDERST